MAALGHCRSHLALLWNLSAMRRRYRPKAIRRVSVWILSLLGVVAVHAGPDLTKETFQSAKILSSADKEITATSDAETIRFILSAMKRAEAKGSNTHGLSLSTTLRFAPAAKPKDRDESGPILQVDSQTSWLVDLKTGHFTINGPPKHALYQFKPADWNKLRKALKLNHG